MTRRPATCATRGIVAFVLLAAVVSCGSKHVAARPAARAGAPATAGSPPPTGSPTAPGAPASTGSPTPGQPPAEAPTNRIAAEPGPYVFPVQGRAEYGRTHGEYPATDVFAACGSPVRAVTGGVVLEVNRVDRFNPNRPLGPDKGGLLVSIRGDDGVRYYGSHLSQVAKGIDPGVRVQPGTQLGLVGKTGNSSQICHLHFGVSPPCQDTGDWWTRRGVVYPWKYLDSWRAGNGLSPADEVRAWQHSRGCPTAPPNGER